MMAGVDSFNFLSKEITSVFTNIRDSLAAVGLFYISHNALNVCVHLLMPFMFLPTAGLLNMISV